MGLAHRRPEEVGIDEPDATAMEIPILDEGEDFVMFGLLRPRESVKQLEDRLPPRKGTAGEFTDHERMADNIARFQKHRQLTIAPSEVIDPDRRVDESHGRRRLTRPPATWHSGFAIRAAECSEFFGGLTGDQRLEPHADELGFLVDAGEPSGG
jgi:hypothetical protein